MLNLMREGASLFQNVSTGNFTDASQSTGRHVQTFQYTGFCAGFAYFYKQALLADPTSAEAEQGLGLSLAKQGNVTEAEKHLKEAVTASHHSPAPGTT